MYPRGFVYLVGYVVIDMMSTYTDIWLCSLIYVWDRLYVDISIQMGLLYAYVSV